MENKVEENTHNEESQDVDDLVGGIIYQRDNNNINYDPMGKIAEVDMYPDDN